jgi:hypothetical protein
MMELLRRQYMASRGKADTYAVYMTVSENHDINIKSAQNVNSRDIDSLLLEMPVEYIYEFKSLIDPVADYHRISVVAVDSGLKIFDASKLTVAALDAMSNVVRGW